MLYCPKCGGEFYDGEQKCARCDAELVSEKPEFLPEVFLTEVANTFEADIIVSQLKSYGIPALKKFPGASQYVSIYTGSSNLGVKIYVPEIAYNDALDIINAPAEDPEKIYMREAPPEDEAPDYGKGLLSGMYTILYITVIAILIAAVAYIFTKR